MTETASQRLDRLMQENNLSLSQNPLQTTTVSDGSVMIKPPLYSAVFTDPTKEKADEPIQGQTPTETNG